MEIGVCVKPVPDPSIISLEGQNRLDPDDMVCMVNPCDRAAVEEAVRLKQMHHAERVTFYQ